MTNSKKPTKRKSTAMTVAQINLAPTQIQLINEQTPQQFIKTKPGRGGKKVKFIEGGYVTNKLNQIFGPINWSFKIIDRGESTRKTENNAEGEVWVYGELTIHDHKRKIEVTKGQSGQHPVHKNVPIGDAYKSAGTDCLKKCASLFGIGLDVYWGQIETQEATGATTKPTKATVKQTSEQKFDDGKKYIEKCTDVQTLRQILSNIDSDKTLTMAHKHQLKKIINARI